MFLFQGLAVSCGGEVISEQCHPQQLCILSQLFNFLPLENLSIKVTIITHIQYCHMLPFSKAQTYFTRSARMVRQTSKKRLPLDLSTSMYRTVDSRACANGSRHSHLVLFVGESLTLSPLVS